MAVRICFKLIKEILFSNIFRKLHIDSAPFHTSKRVDQLINDVETLYTDTLESGDRNRAMKRLRVPPLEEKQSPSVTFRVGLFVGKNLSRTKKTRISIFYFF
jgi:hypothetical protein